MTPKIILVLKEMNKLMESAAWGSSLPLVAKNNVEQGTPGTGEAVNNSSSQDNLDFYIMNLCKSLQDEFDIDEDSAFEFVMDASEEMSDQAMLPELPSPEDSDQQASMWLGAAKTVGFEGYCIKMVRDHMVKGMQSLRDKNMSKGIADDFDMDDFDGDSF